MATSEATRRDILELLLGREAPFHGRLDLVDFLNRVWNLREMPSTDHRFKDAAGDIWQHMIRNYDWDTNYLLYERLNLPGCPDSEFLRFLEMCVHPVVCSDPEDAQALAQAINERLAADGYRLEPTSEMSGRPVYEAIAEEPGAAPLFEIALSFAGEDREYVEAVAHRLLADGVQVFYDRFEEATLWGKDLAEHLDAVYRGSARYCVMFISSHYAERLWPTHERRSALAHALESRTEYILPARFDDTEIPGLRPTVGYVALRRVSPQELARLILQKLGR